MDASRWAGDAGRAPPVDALALLTETGHLRAALVVKPLQHPMNWLSVLPRGHGRNGRCDLGIGAPRAADKTPLPLAARSGV